MNIIDAQVKHSRFGIGRVIGQTDNTLEVRFCLDHSCKKFVYPGAFQSFLAFASDEMQKEVLQEIKAANEEFKQQRSVRGQEYKERKEQERLEAAAQKKAFAKMAKAAKMPVKSKNTSTAKDKV